MDTGYILVEPFTAFVHYLNCFSHFYWLPLSPFLSFIARFALNATTKAPSLFQLERLHLFPWWWLSKLKRDHLDDVPTNILPQMHLITSCTTPQLRTSPIVNHCHTKTKGVKLFSYW